MEGSVRRLRVWLEQRDLADVLALTRSAIGSGGPREGLAPEGIVVIRGGRVVHARRRKHGRADPPRRCNDVMRSFPPKTQAEAGERQEPGPGDQRNDDLPSVSRAPNPEAHFDGEEWSNATQASTNDPEARWM